jgi:hypothetical protein
LQNKCFAAHRPNNFLREFQAMANCGGSELRVELGISCRSVSKIQRVAIVRPTAVLIAIVFGSAAAISFGLITTGIVFGFLQSDHPELAGELRPLIAGCAWFVGLGCVSGAALYATQKDLRWRAYAQAGTILVMVAVGMAYWPRR